MKREQKNISPAGAKRYFYEGSFDEFQEVYRSKWGGIYRGAGMGAKSSQQIITELLVSHDVQQAAQDDILRAFQRGKKIEHGMMKDEASSPYASIDTGESKVKRQVGRFTIAMLRQRDKQQIEGLENPTVRSQDQKTSSQALELVEHINKVRRQKQKVE